VLGQRFGADVAHADGADLPLHLQRQQRVHGLRDRGRGILPMREVQVDAVGLQALQALLHLMPDRLGPEVAVYRVAVFVEEVLAIRRVPDQAALGGDDGAVAAAFERLADQPLGAPQAVGRSGVDQVAAGVERGLDRADRGSVVAATPHPAAHGPGAQADGRALDARWSQHRGFHRIAFRTLSQWSMVTATSRIRPLMTSCQYTDTSSRMSELVTTDSSASPSTAPNTVPEPPFRLAPPITAAAITFSSMPTPKVGVAAPKRAV